MTADNGRTHATLHAERSRIEDTDRIHTDIKTHDHLANESSGRHVPGLNSDGKVATMSSSENDGGHGRLEVIALTLP